jgi:hypothetical protein
MVVKCLFEGEHKLQVCESKVIRKECVGKRDEVRDNLRYYLTENYVLYRSPIIRVVKSRRL